MLPEWYEISLVDKIVGDILVLHGPQQACLRKNLHLIFFGKKFVSSYVQKQIVH